MEKNTNEGKDQCIRLDPKEWRSATKEELEEMYKNNPEFGSAGKQKRSYCQDGFFKSVSKVIEPDADGGFERRDYPSKKKSETNTEMECELVRENLPESSEFGSNVLNDEDYKKKEVVNFVKFVSDSGRRPEDKREILESTGLLDESIYENLPEILRYGTSFYPQGSRERDVFLTGAIGVLSGCFPKVYGIYDRNKYQSNLNVFITAPPASGKGVLTHSRDLVALIHDHLQKENEGLKCKIERGLKTDGLLNKDVPYIPEKVLYIPGNSSSSGMLRLLHDNSGVGIMCETEADTLNTIMAKEWGNYSEIIRCATHHEAIRQARVTSGYIEILHPKLSVILTGTPDQLTKFIPSTEDGLFSRFLFYAYVVDPKWRNPSPKEGEPHARAYFRKLAKFVFDAYKFYLSEEREFTLSSEQWDLLNNKFERWTVQIKENGIEDISGTIFRYGLYQFRLSMLLTIIRNFDEHITSVPLVCNLRDFIVADHMIETYLSHSLAAYQLLPKKTTFNPNKGYMRFLAKFPDDVELSRKEAVEIGAAMGLSDSSVDKYLRKLIDTDQLEIIKTGFYMKATVEKS